MRDDLDQNDGRSRPKWRKIEVAMKDPDESFAAYESFAPDESFAAGVIRGRRVIRS